MVLSPKRPDPREPVIQEIAVIAERKTNGAWFTGPHGPYRDVYGAMTANGVRCALMSLMDSYQTAIVIDGVHIGDFDGCAFERAPKGRMLVRAWRNEPDVGRSQGERHEYLVSANAACGPFKGLCPHKGLIQGMFIGNHLPTTAGRYGQCVYYEDVVYGPFDDIDVVTDGSGEEYLLCSPERHAQKRTIIGRKGLLGEFESVEWDRTVAIKARPKIDGRECCIIFGGGPIATIRAEAIDCRKVGRNLLMLARNDGSASLHLNGRAIAGPYYALSDLTVDDEGFLAFTAFEVDGFGTTYCKRYGGRVPTGL